MSFLADTPITTSPWKVGDWCIHDLNIGQILRLPDSDGSGYAEFSDGSFSTSGRLSDRFRPLTLQNKYIIEWFAAQYGYLHKIAGEGGFNYPDIHHHFENLAREAIDGEPECKAPFDKATEFVRSARDYQPIIQGVALFRPARR